MLVQELHLRELSICLEESITRWLCTSVYYDCRDKTPATIILYKKKSKKANEIDDKILTKVT
jgi:hypothetical protein